jgi:hypothetical protein
MSAAQAGVFSLQVVHSTTKSSEKGAFEALPIDLHSTGAEHGSHTRQLQQQRQGQPRCAGAEVMGPRTPHVLFCFSRSLGLGKLAFAHLARFNQGDSGGGGIQKLSDISEEIRGHLGLKRDMPLVGNGQHKWHRHAVGICSATRL